MNNKVLIIEDDADLLEAISSGLTYEKYSVETAMNGATALEKIKSNHFNIILSDVQLPGENGLNFLSALKERNVQTPIIFMTAHATVKDAVYALQNGASDYITKPFDLNDLIEKMSTKILEDNAEKYKQKTSDQKMDDVYQLAKQVAQTNASVLLSGESGTGKEVIARYIYDNSARSTKPFIAINCAAIPDNMLEALLFGYEKGSFTGAHQASEGKFEQANGGTLLLDEVSEMPLGLQAKILRVLQEKEVERLGSKKTIALDVRIIATTNKDLKLAVAKNEFRGDLYFRLNVFPISLPPLRNRKNDIVHFASYFVDKYSQSQGCTLSKKALNKLLNYRWPGNVRELENVIQRACIVSPSDIILPEHIFLEEIDINSDNTDKSLELSETLESTEHEAILENLKSLNGNRTETAKILGISPRTLRYKLAKMKELGFSIPGRESKNESN